MEAMGSSYEETDIRLNANSDEVVGPTVYKLPASTHSKSMQLWSITYKLISWSEMPFDAVSTSFWSTSKHDSSRLKMNLVYCQVLEVLARRQHYLTFEESPFRNP